MADWQLKTPVAFVIFNRPHTTEKVFEAIRQAKPPKLLVIADGPREDKPGEAEKCAAARAIIEQVDWDCEVLKNYSDVNLGCGRRPSSGFDWVFDTVEEAIILEDDCVPDPTFFRFCEDLLEYYRHDERIMSITGLNVQFGRKRTADSYYFSRYTNSWGWASWRRAWKYFDYEMKLWPEIKQGNFLTDILGEPRAVKVWSHTFDFTVNGHDAWDFQWAFACWLQRGLTIIPNENLISYIGYSLTDATHTKEERSQYNNLKVEAMDFPLKHPKFVIRDRQADNFTENTYYDYQPRLLKKVTRKLQKVLGMKYSQSW
ncbi:MAG: glycosyltransferase family 2 protein [Kastovskya adunca ATA6-11-RM4]|jgi:hypothetical protein|nr:glycosyltransferase family 2 protein [Kastovskya adunca ATA6-11-RM4]